MFTPSTLAMYAILGVGLLFAVPVLAKGFMRRGTGTKYEKNFLIQRAPQLVSVFTIFLIAFSVFAYNGFFKSIPSLVPFIVLTDVTQAPGALATAANVVSWIGNVILLSGLIFMIGGWYSLGEMFSTDAEVMEDHKVKDTGLLAFVMSSPQNLILTMR